MGIEVGPVVAGTLLAAGFGSGGLPTGPRRIRVVFLDHVALLSGGELALLRLIAAMPVVDAHVVLGADGPLRAELEAAGVTVEVLPLDSRIRDTRRDQLAGGVTVLRSALLVVGYIIRLARRLHAIGPDVVHTNSLKAGYYGSVAARLVRIPVVWHVRDRIAPDYLPQRVVTVTRWMLKHLPDVVVANSAETLRATGLDGERVLRRLRAVVPSTLSMHVFHDTYTARHGRHSSLEPHRPFTVGIVGRLAPWKGQDVLIRAMARPKLAGASLHIVGSAMFGEDAWEAELHRLATNLGVAERVTFVGFTRDVEQELSALDVLVHASVLPEPFGQVVVEGMAAGLPVVATNAGGPAEIITHNLNGLLVPPGDDNALADALTQLRAEPDTRKRLGDAALLRARDFAPEAIGARMVAIYMQLLSPDGPSSVAVRRSFLRRRPRG